MHFVQIMHVGIYSHDEKKQYAQEFKDSATTVRLIAE